MNNIVLNVNGIEVIYNHVILVQKPEDWPFSSASKSDDPPTP